MRVAFVVPRYGTAIIGGAETAARLFAEHLVSGQGWTVEVLTTCAADFTTWEEVYPAGTETINGVHVERVAAEAGRDPSFHPFSAGLLADPRRVTLADAERWVDLQGPNAPALAERATSATADVVVFYPYLYYPTVRAIGRTRAPAVLHPAAHDEPALQLPVFDRVLTAADGLVFQTEAERQLVQRRVPVASHLQLLLGLGVNDPDARRAAGGSESARPTARSAARSAAQPEDPYLVCLGRVDRYKGVHLLVDLFAAYKARHPGLLRLVLAGPVVDPPAARSDVDMVGVVSEDDKWDLLAGALALVSPSPWEAFSLAVAESWSARTPVLVHAGCGATVEHCRRSGGGISFAGFGEFEVAVERLCADAIWRRSLGERGRAYVDERFRWPEVIDRYARFLERVVEARCRVAPSGDAGTERSPTAALDDGDAEDGDTGTDLPDPVVADGPSR
jgi:glycosyltransferase involved in cell wall biosynthesis